MDISPEPGGAAEPHGQVVQGGGPLPSVRGVGQGLAAGKPGKAPGCFLPDMLVVAAEELVDVEQEAPADRALGLQGIFFFRPSPKGQHKKRLIA